MARIYGPYHTSSSIGHSGVLDWTYIPASNTVFSKENLWTLIGDWQRSKPRLGCKDHLIEIEHADIPVKEIATQHQASHLQPQWAFVWWLPVYRTQSARDLIEPLMKSQEYQQPPLDDAPAWYISLATIDGTIDSTDAIRLLKTGVFY
jgi:hypothetical protein